MKMNRRNAIKNTGILAGMAVLTPSLTGLLQSCQDEDRSTWMPQFFNKEEADFLSSMVDTIIPTTDTQGGLDVQVDMFLDKMVSEGYDLDGQSYMRSEIGDLRKQCLDKFGKAFPELSQAEKNEFLKGLEASSGKISPAVWGTGVGDQSPPGFYRSLKSMMIWAFLSSKPIATKVLNHDPIPGEYKGCIPLSEVGARWS